MIDGTATLNGLTIGSGTLYTWTEWPSGLGTPEIRSDDRSRPRRRGATGADDLLGVRTVAFAVQVLGSRSEIEEALAALEAAFAPSSSDVWLQLRLSGSPAEYALLGRPRGCEWALSKKFTFGVGEARCTFAATDPVKYGPALSVGITLGTAGTGFVLPRMLPGVLGSGSTSGIGSCPNAGTVAVDWTATIAGPVLNPRLEDIESGRFVRLVADLAAGETVTLDSGAGAVLLAGTAARPTWVAPGSRWWQLDPGANSLRYTADLGSGACQIDYRPGWA